MALPPTKKPKKEEADEFDDLGDIDYDAVELP